MVGENVPGVTRVYDLFKHKYEIDFFVFPDVGFTEEQEELRSLIKTDPKMKGKRVWGMGKAEFMEDDRWAAHQVMDKKLGMAVAEVVRLQGLTELQNYLKNKEDLYIKISHWRGDMETYHYRNDQITKYWYQKQAEILGPKAEHQIFLVETKIPGVEVGYDGFTVDGKRPPIACWGYEVKDQAYFGRFQADGAMPEPVREINNRLKPIFELAQSRGFYSTEIRIGDDKVPYLTDPCMRCGNPPTPLLVEAYKNYAEMMWEGAGGKVVTPEPIAKYGCLALMVSENAKDDFVAIDYPKELERWVKLCNYTVDDDGIRVVIPNPNIYNRLSMCGSVIGFGNTIHEAVRKCGDVAKKVIGDGLEIQTEAFEDAEKVTNQGTKYGLYF